MDDGQGRGGRSNLVRQGRDGWMTVKQRWTRMHVQQLGRAKPPLPVFPPAQARVFKPRTRLLNYQVGLAPTERGRMEPICGIFSQEMTAAAQSTFSFVPAVRHQGMQTWTLPRRGLTTSSLFTHAVAMPDHPSHRPMAVRRALAV